jgi:hypothetical protein
MRSLLSDVKYWFSRAEEMRMIAEAMHDPEAARIMAGISAASYNPKKSGGPTCAPSLSGYQQPKWPLNWPQCGNGWMSTAMIRQNSHIIRYGNIVSVYLIFEEDAEAEATPLALGRRSAAIPCQR